MSLQIWLPLNGNLNNQGLEFTAAIGCSKQEYTNNGKLCEKMFTGSSDIIVNSTALKNTKMWSYCYWGYVKSASVTANWVGISLIEDGGNNLRTEVCPSSFNNGIYCYSIHNNATNMITNTAISSPTGGYYDKWVHFCLTSDGKTITRYMNGVKTGTASYNGSGRINGTFLFSNSHIVNKQDIRIYDNCLSAREVKEIAKGIVVHYPLSNLYNTTLSSNKYKGDNAEGKGEGSSFTITKLANERGYNYKFSYTGTGKSQWHNFYFPHVSFTAGKIYDYSCKTRCNSTTNVQLFFRASRVGNDWVASMQNICEKTGVWVERHIRLKLAATSDRSGSTLTTSPLIEFYTNDMSTSGTSYAVNVDIKDIQIAESPNNTDIPFMDSRFVDTTMIDTAGYRCTATPSGSIGLSSNTPRYDASYVFDSKAYFKSTQPVVRPSQFSVSFWVYPISCGTYSTVIANAGDPSTGFWIAVNTESVGLWFYNGSYLKSNKGLLSMNTWHHAVFVFNNGVCTWYQNGENAGSADLSSRTKTLGISNTIAIGNSYTGSSWNTNFNGCISDVRMYATALSAADVKELYNTPISLTNTGVLMTQGEFKEE